MTEETVTVAPGAREITVRPSSLGGYMTCARSAWIQDNIRHVDEDLLNPPTLSINAKVGSCLHDLIARPEEDLRPVVDDWFNRNVVHNDKERDKLVMSRDITGVEDAVRATNNLLSAYRSHGLMKVFAEADHLHESVLQKSYATKSGKVVHLKGRLDIYKPEGKELIDVKTSAQTSPGYYGTQMAAYALLLKGVKGIEVEKTTVYFARMNKQFAPPIIRQTYDVATNRRHLQQVVKVIDRFDEMAGEEREATRVVANPGCWKCSKKWCRAFDTPYCPETQTTKVAKE